MQPAASPVPEEIFSRRIPARTGRGLLKSPDFHRSCLLYTSNLTNEALSGILEGPKECHEAYYVADMACRQLEELKREEAPFMMRVD